MARTQTRIYVFLAVCGFFFNKSEVQWIHLFCKPVGISYLQTSGSGGAVALRVYGKSAQMHPQPKTIEYNLAQKFQIYKHTKHVKMVNERTLFLAKSLFITIPLLHFVGVVNFLASWILQRRGFHDFSISQWMNK